MRGESMKDKSKKTTYSTTFGVDPKNQPIPQPLVLTRKLSIEGPCPMRRLSLKSTDFGVDPFGVDPFNKGRFHKAPSIGFEPMSLE